MTPSRAEELRESVTDDIRKRVEEKEYGEVVLNLGKDYLRAVDGLSGRCDVDISTVQGGGIGEKGKQLKRFVRSDTIPSVVS